MAAIGIDLGTSNSCIAYVGKDGKPEVIVNNRGSRTTPSMINLSSERLTIGEAARSEMNRHPESIICGLKYIIGRKADDEVVKKFIEKNPNRITFHEDKIKFFTKNNDEYVPEELSAILIKRLKTYAEDKIGNPVEKAVITVPTYFSDSQRQATIDAGKIAGFIEIKLINEPVAAATAYGVEHEIKDGNVLVFDFGGGFDVSIINCKNNVFSEIRMEGDLNLGGNDIDEKLLQYVQKKLDINETNKRKLIRLRKKCEQLKIELTNKEEDAFEYNEDTEITIKKTEFNEEIKEFLDRLMAIVKKCLEQSKLQVNNINDVVLVGGSSRIPAIYERIRSFFRKHPKKMMNPDEAVAVGAAITAAMWEKVAYKDVQLNTLAPYSIGLELKGKFMRILVTKYTQLPVTKKVEKIHPDHGGAEVNLRVFCGEGKLTENNSLVGEMEFKNIKQAPDGIRWLVVIFELNVDCILKVSAEDCAGKKSNMTINVNKGNLSDKEIATYRTFLVLALLKPSTDEISYISKSIDLGTSNSCIAYVGKDGKPEVIVNDRGFRTTPSVINLSSERITIGEAARSEMHRHPESIMCGIKYIIGRNADDEVVKKFKEKNPYDIAFHEDKIKFITKNNDEYVPEELSAILIKRLKIYAEDKIGNPVEKAVVTVPTYFSDSQRQATIDAGKIAGFKEIKLINEPVAAATAYGVEHEIKNGNVLVFDFGGGTFDVSIINCKNNVFSEIGIEGDLNLGGNNIDEKLLQYVQKKLNINETDKRKLIRLRKKCEQLKIELTNKEEHAFEYNDDIETTITRTEFNEEIKEFLDKLMETVQKCLLQSKLQVNNINDVVLVGGSSKIPAFYKRITSFFRKHPKKMMNPDEAVAVGAAITAAMWEKVAYKDVQLNTLAPYSIGLELRGKFMRILVSKYTQLPVTRKVEKVHPDHGGADVNLRVFCGEDILTENNSLVGQMEFKNIKQAPDGIRWLVVTFELNVDCILKVSAEDSAGKKSNMTINVNKGNLNDEEIATYRTKLANKTIA